MSLRCIYEQAANFHKEQRVLGLFSKYGYHLLILSLEQLLLSEICYSKKRKWSDSFGANQEIVIDIQNARKIKEKEIFVNELY